MSIKQRFEGEFFFGRHAKSIKLAEPVGNILPRAE